MQDQRELLSIYRNFPCRTLPNAYWKTETRLAGGTLDIRYGSGGELSKLAVWQDNACLAFWSGNSSHHAEAVARLVDCDYALVHASCLKLVPAQVFNQRRAYFRLSHAGTGNQIDPLPQFSIRQARPEMEAEAVAGLIQRCYPNITISSEIVRQWLDHPVYDQELWVWIEDLEKGVSVGLGIAERDEHVPEASLEWIQVLPEYQGRGIGSMLVSELLHRAAQKVDIITVSGEVQHLNRPEQLYRSCGFTGSDVWWYLAR